MKKILIVFFFLLFSLFCEDKIVALVGNKVIFESEIIKRVNEEKIPYSISLEKLIEEKLLLYRAEKEGIGVSEDEIKNEIKKIKENFPSNKEFYNYLKKQGLTITKLKDRIKDTIKINKLIRKEIIDRIRISPVEIDQEIKKIENSLKEYEFYFKFFNTKDECEKFIKEFKKEKLKEMEYANLKSFEIMDEILSEIEKMEKDNLSNPIKIKNNWVVVYLVNIKKAEMDKYEIYKQAKEKIFKTKYSSLYKDYIQKLKNSIPVKFL